MPKRRKYETHPKIDMTMLVRNGLLDPKRDKPLGVWSGGSSMLIWYSPSKKQAELYFETRFEPSQLVVVHQTIDVGFARKKSGPEPYFVCPDSGARCQELHLNEDHFVSRRAHPMINADKPPPAHRREAKLAEMRDRILGRNGRPVATGQERHGLLARLVREPFLRLRFPELKKDADSYFETVQRNRRKMARASLVGHDDSFALALFDGRLDTTPLDVSEHLARSPQDWLATIPEPRDRFGNSPLGYLEDQIALDIRKLAKKWRLDENGIWARRINWSGLKAVLIVDFRDPATPLLALREVVDKAGQAIDDVIIKLLPSKFKSRWFMECPLSGRRCDILYWRDDVFASARAARYVHRSQRRWRNKHSGTRARSSSQRASG